jgi:hypothetical protein
MSDNNPTGILDTPAGKVHFCMTAADHVYLHSESSPADNPVEAVTFHRIRYHVNCHCYLVDGVWTAKDWHEPYLRRKDTHGEASNAARKTARESLGRAWTEYLAAHPELSRQAALSNAKDCLDRLEAQADDLAEQLDAKKEECRAARNAYNAIEMSTLLK